MTLGCNGLQNGQSRVISFLKCAAAVSRADNDGMWRQGALFLCMQPHGEKFAYLDALCKEGGKVQDPKKERGGRSGL